MVGRCHCSMGRVHCRRCLLAIPRLEEGWRNPPFYDPLCCGVDGRDAAKKRTQRSAVLKCTARRNFTDIRHAPDWRPVCHHATQIAFRPRRPGRIVRATPNGPCRWGAWGPLGSSGPRISALEFPAHFNPCTVDVCGVFSDTVHAIQSCQPRVGKRDLKTCADSILVIDRGTLPTLLKRLDG